jgi:8-oxo-dGTP pyrophosphatase MutT (NUDIX family)
MSLRDDGSGENQPTQCAALPYRMKGGLVEVLLVTPRGGEGWIIPKGKVEPKLSVPQSAALEAVEEGGVRGEIEQAPFDQYRHGGTDDGPLVAVYLMRVTKEMSSWRESHQRERRWATLDDVPRLVVDPGLARVMRAAADHLSTYAPATWPSEEAAAAPNARIKLVGSALLVAAALGLAAAFLT